MREVTFQKAFSKHADGSVMVSFGDTRVLCTAMVEERQPRFRRDTELGWLTGEYRMLPSSTHTRKSRDRVDGRSTEISRLIGRSLRGCLNFEALGPRTISIDCDVIQADGGTRTAAITGAYVALDDAIKSLLKKGVLTENPILSQVAAVSVGIVDGECVVDLDYAKDCKAEVDMNIVANDKGEFIEVQGAAEQKTFSRDRLNSMLDGALEAIGDLIKAQKKILED